MPNPGNIICFYLWQTDENTHFGISLITSDVKWFSISVLDIWVSSFVNCLSTRRVKLATLRWPQWPNVLSDWSTGVVETQLCNPGGGWHWSWGLKFTTFLLYEWPPIPKAIAQFDLRLGYVMSLHGYNIDKRLISLNHGQNPHWG